MVAVLLDQPGSRELAGELGDDHHRCGCGWELDFDCADVALPAGLLGTHQVPLIGRDREPGQRVPVAAVRVGDRVVELTPRAILDQRPPERTELTPGEALFRQGDQGTLVYEVDEGKIEIVRELADGGGEEILSIVEPGGYFGELAPMFGLRRAASARAGTAPAVVTAYTLRDFRGRRGSDVLDATDIALDPTS